MLGFVILHAGGTITVALHCLAPQVQGDHGGSVPPGRSAHSQTECIPLLLLEFGVMHASQTCDRWLNAVEPALEPAAEGGTVALGFLTLVGCLCGVKLLLSVRTSGIGLQLRATCRAMTLRICI